MILVFPILIQIQGNSIKIRITAPPKLVTPPAPGTGQPSRAPERFAASRRLRQLLLNPSPN